MMCVCSYLCSSVNLTQNTCLAFFILRHETSARGETQLWEVRMKKEEEANTESRMGGLELQGWDL